MDLMEPSKPRLQLRDDGEGSFELVGAAMVELDELEQTLQLATIANSRRKVSTTVKNATSSHRCVVFYEPCLIM
jgi:hypothetical protein